MAFRGEYKPITLSAEQPTPDIKEAELALHAFKKNESLKLNGKSIECNSANFIGGGGFKKAYDVGNGKALTIRNTAADKVDTECAIRWCEAVYEEKLMADKLRGLGLKTLDHQVIAVTVHGNKLPVLYTTSFAMLESKGLQVRDPKYFPASRGKTMLFGAKENINSTHFKLLFKYILQDIVCLVRNGIKLNSGDSFNLCIEDTSVTPQYDRNESKLFTERQQRVRLFFFDFTNKYKKLNLVTAPLNPELFRSQVSDLLDNAFEVLIYSTRDDEQKLFGSASALAELARPVFTEIKKELIEQTIEAINKPQKENASRALETNASTSPDTMFGQGRMLCTEKFKLPNNKNARCTIM